MSKSEIKLHSNIKNETNNNNYHKTKRHTYTTRLEDLSAEKGRENKQEKETEKSQLRHEELTVCVLICVVGNQRVDRGDRFQRFALSFSSLH